MSSTALVRASAAGGGVAEEKDKFERLVLSFGDPNDIAVVADPKGQEIDVKVVYASTKKPLCTTSPAMMTGFVKDTGEGDLGGKNKFDAQQRSKARYTIALGPGTIRPQNAIDDPDILLRQRAWQEYGRRVCANAMGQIFDTNVSKMFTALKAKLIADCKNFQHRLLTKEFSVKNPGTAAEDIAHLVEYEISTNPAIGEEIRLEARAQFIGQAKNAFVTKNNNADPRFSKAKVYTVRHDRVAKHERGKRPDGPSVTELPPTPENWPEIYLRTGREYVWSPFTYKMWATGEVLPRPTRKYRVKQGLRRRVEAMMTVQELTSKTYKADNAMSDEEKEAKRKDTVRLTQALSEVDDPTVRAGDDAVTDVVMPDPEWSPIHGLKWQALISTGFFINIYKQSEGGYGTSLSPTKTISVFDRVPSAGKSGPAVGGDHAAAAAVGRNFIADEENAALLMLAAPAGTSARAGEKRKADDADGGGGEDTGDDEDAAGTA